MTQVSYIVAVDNQCSRLAAHALSDDPVTFAFDLPEIPPEIAPIEDATHALLSAVTVPPSRMMIRRALFRDPGFFDPGIFLPDFLPPLQASLGGRIGELQVAVSAGHSVSPSQERRGGGQAEHDLSAAVAAFVAAHPELSARCRRVAVRGAARRAWRSARKRRAAGLTARFSWLYIKALVGVPMDVAAALADSLSAWDGDTIRRPVVKP